MRLMAASWIMAADRWGWFRSRGPGGGGARPGLPACPSTPTTSASSPSSTRPPARCGPRNLQSTRLRTAAEEHRRHPRQAETPGQARHPHRDRPRQLRQEAVTDQSTDQQPCPTFTSKRTSTHGRPSQTSMYATTMMESSVVGCFRAPGSWRHVSCLPEPCTSAAMTCSKTV